MSKNYYPEALEICLNDKTDFKAIVVAIAKTHPSLVVKKDPFYDWRIEAKRLCFLGQNVQAIQLCSEKTGVSIKKAKELVESL